MAEQVQTIRRKDAARLLDKILVQLAHYDHDTVARSPADAEVFIRDLKILIAQAHLGLLEPCPGEAHRNPAGYDNCGVCMPRWGYVGPKVKVT